MQHDNRDIAPVLCLIFIIHDGAANNEKDHHY